MEKLIYTSPLIEIVEFNNDDITTASTNQYDPENISGGEATNWWTED